MWPCVGGNDQTFLGEFQLDDALMLPNMVISGAEWYFSLEVWIDNFWTSAAGKRSILRSDLMDGHLQISLVEDVISVCSYEGLCAMSQISVKQAWTKIEISIEHLNCENFQHTIAIQTESKHVEKAFYGPYAGSLGLNGNNKSLMLAPTNDDVLHDGLIRNLEFRNLSGKSIFY